LWLFLRGAPLSREQLFEVLRQAHHRELLDDDTLLMMERVAVVSDLQVDQVMVARAQMVTVDSSQTLDELLPVIIESAHSRFPVTGGDRDTVLGILLAKDLLRHLRENGDHNLPWERLLRPVVFIPESKRLNVLLQEFRASRNHMAIVVDEYGGVVGLVTIEDVLEQIVGDIEDEHDVDEGAGMVLRRGTDYCVVKAMMPISSFNQTFDTELNPLEFDTLGGLVTSKLGHLPARGESVDLPGIHVEVLSADSRLPRLLRVTRKPLP
jgi:magnesium and cobalt transporter